MEALALPPVRRSDKALARFAKDTMPTGSRSNLAHRESTSAQNVDLEDDFDEDPADVPEEVLEAEVDNIFPRAEYAMKREVEGQDHGEISTSHLEDAPERRLSLASLLQRDKIMKR